MLTSTCPGSSQVTGGKEGQVTGWHWTVSVSLSHLQISHPFCQVSLGCLGGSRAEQLGPKVVVDISMVGLVDMNVTGCVGLLFVVGEEGVVVVNGMEVDGVMQDVEIFTI